MSFLSRFHKSEFVRNVATLLSGNVLAQVITIGAAPVVTRLFSPAEFGLFALFMAIVGVVSKVGSLCYERAILLPADDRDAAAVLMLSLFILIFLAAGVWTIGLAFGESIARLLGNSNLSEWLFLVPVSVVVIGVANILRYWAMRRKALKLVATARVAEAAFSASIKVGVGFVIGSWAGGLIAGAFVGSFVALMLLTMPLYRVGIGNILSKDLLQHISKVAYQYRQFPFFASWAALLNVFSISMLVFFLSAFFGAAIVGFYNLAQRMLAQPIATIANSVARAYFLKSASQLTNKQKLVPGLRKTMFVLALIGLVPFSVLGIFGSEIFIFIFGDKWATAGQYAQILTPWFFMTFLLAPAAIVFEVCQQQRVKLWINATTLGGGVGIILTLQQGGYSADLIISGFVVVNILMSFVQMIFALRIANSHDRVLYCHQ